MANKTIPQLPLQTGVTDLDLFAIVDSGETTTSSITRSEFMSGATNTTFQNVTLTPDSVIYSPPALGKSWGNFTVVDSSSPGTITKHNGTVVISNNNPSFTTPGNNASMIATTNFSMLNSVGSVSMTNSYGGNNGNRTVVIGGSNGNISGNQNFVGSSYVNSVSNSNCVLISPPYGQNITGTFTASISNSQANKTIAGSYNTGISNNGGSLTTSGANCGMYNSKDSNITGSTEYAVMLGCSGRTATSNFTTYVENLEAFDGIVMTDYANLDFADDAAAATGGVPLGGLYHNSGAMRIRIT